MTCGAKAISTKITEAWYDSITAAAAIQKGMGIALQT